MVLFTNIHVNQRVEVKWQGEIHTGVIKYKGCLNGIPGEWVGMELDSKDGKHNGTLNGRRYFQCLPGHGIFTQARNIRFIRMKRCLYNRYRTVEDEPEEEDLFTRVERPPVDDREIFISHDYERQAACSFPNRSTLLDPPRRYPLRHPVGNYLRAATMTPEQARFTLSSYRDPILYDYYDEDEFTTSPTIPKTHMPHAALRKQVRRGWDNAHYVREMSVNTGRDSMRYSQWNNIS